PRSRWERRQPRRYYRRDGRNGHLPRRRRRPRPPARAARRRPRLGRGGADARGDACARVPRGRPRLPGVPASAEQRGIRAGTHRAQIRARPVGRDCPVARDPQCNEEYARARAERKSGRGHRGFVVDADPSVTLEEDLGRRDFTINAIAQAPDGSLVDPFGGSRDLEQRVLRHVGPAFAEDPLSVLRAARFMARFAPLGFSVADETMALMRTMVESGELSELVPERVWQELSRGLASAAPSAFLRTLRDCG